MAIDPAALLEDLLAWRERYESGRIRFRGLRTPKLDDGERAGVWTPRIRVLDAGADPRVDEEPLPDAVVTDAFGPHVLPKSVGTLFATSTQLHLRAGRGQERSWWWGDTVAVRLLHPPLGVRLRSREGRSELVGRSWHATVPGARPDDARLIATWLQVEACWADGSGQLEEWFAGLPARLRSGLR